MEPSWQAIAQRVVYGLQIQPGELIQVRGNVDFTIPGVTLKVDGRVIVEDELVV